MQQHMAAQGAVPVQHHSYNGGGSAQFHASSGPEMLGQHQPQMMIAPELMGAQGYSVQQQQHFQQQQQQMQWQQMHQQQMQQQMRQPQPHGLPPPSQIGPSHQHQQLQHQLAMAVAGTQAPPAPMQQPQPHLPQQMAAQPAPGAPPGWPTGAGPIGNVQFAQLRAQQMHAQWVMQQPQPPPQPQLQPAAAKPKSAARARAASPGSKGDKPASASKRPGGSSRKSGGASQSVASCEPSADDASSPWWNLHGMHLRIPPFWAQLGEWEAAAPLGYGSYAQWARSVGPSGAPLSAEAGGSARSRSRASRAEGAKRGREEPEEAGEEEAAEDAAMDALREEGDRWRRCWAIVVRRDVAKQQRALVTQQREAHAIAKRAALGAQKEVRKQALAAQRHGAPSQVQLRCKRLVRDMQAAARRDAAQLADAQRAAEREAWRRVAARRQEPSAAQGRWMRLRAACVDHATLVRVDASPPDTLFADGLRRRLAVASVAVGQPAAAAPPAHLLRSLMAYRLGACHRWLVAPPQTPLLLRPPGAAQLESLASRVAAAEPRPALAPPPPLLVVAAPALVWAMRAQRRARNAAEDEAVPSDAAETAPELPLGTHASALHAACARACADAAAPLARLPRAPSVVERIVSQVDASLRSAFWSGAASAWARLLASPAHEGALRDAADAFFALRSAIAIATLRAVAAPPAAALPPLPTCSAPRPLPRRATPLLLPPRCAPPSASPSPSSGVAALLGASAKLRSLDTLLRTLAEGSRRGAEAKTVLVFAPAAVLPPIERLLAFRRIPLLASSSVRGGKGAPLAVALVPVGSLAPSLPAQALSASAVVFLDGFDSPARQLLRLAPFDNEPRVFYLVHSAKGTSASAQSLEEAVLRLHLDAAAQAATAEELDVSPLPPGLVRALAM